MKRTSKRPGFPFIRPILMLFVVLLAIYIPLKIHIARSGEATPVDVSFSIFVTSDLKGYREPCG